MALGYLVCIHENGTRISIKHCDLPRYPYELLTLYLICIFAIGFYCYKRKPRITPAEPQFWHPPLVYNSEKPVHISVYSNTLFNDG